MSLRLCRWVVADREQSRSDAAPWLTTCPWPRTSLAFPSNSEHAQGNSRATHAWTDPLRWANPLETVFVREPMTSESRSVPTHRLVTKWQQTAWNTSGLGVPS